MANLLLRYELGLLRRSFAEAFARRRDKLLLLLVFALLFLWLRQAVSAAGSLSLPPEAIWAAALAGPVGFAWQRLLALRLGWLKEHSVVARAALEPRTQRRYLLAAHAAVTVPLGLAATALGVATGRIAVALGIAALAYGLCLLLAQVSREALLASPAEPVPVAPSTALAQRPGGRRRAVTIALLRRQTFDSPHPLRVAGAVVAATFVLTALAGRLAAGSTEAAQLAAIVLPSLLSLLLVTRTDSVLIGFLPYAGFRPMFVALAVSALPAACFAAATVATLAARPPQAGAGLALLALVYLGFIAIGIARAWLYPGRQGRAVDLQVQIEFAGLVVIGILMPPLAVVALVWRLWILNRRYRERLWVQP